MIKNMSNKKIQKVKLHYQDIFKCPYCGKTLIPEEWDEKKNVCKHLLYIQNDSSIVYLSKRIRHILENEKGFNLEIIDDLANEQDAGLFLIGDIVAYPSLVEYEFYSEAPGGISTFVGISDKYK